MEAKIDFGPEPVGRDWDTLLVLLAACPFGILMWAGLLFAIARAMLAAWSVAVAIAAT
jgi:hypothetical protein